jgi:hypothetical protein
MNFQKFPKSDEEPPNMHKIPPGSSENAQNPTRSFQKCKKIHEAIKGLCAFLEVPHGILCIFRISSWQKNTRIHFILSLFSTCILIDCGYRWPQPVQA